MNKISLFSLSVIAFMTGFSGCGGGGAADQPDLGALTGTITVDGSPRKGLEVSFQPESGRPSIATTDESGHFEMQYTTNETGAKVGKGVMRVTDGESGGSESYGSEEESSDEEGEDESYGDENEAIPAQYNVDAAANSEMNITVEAGGTEFNLDIKTK